ncbi:MAG: Gldg family protein [Gemmatimonadota bacterium]
MKARIGRAWTIAKREVAGYVDHATAYILLVVFLGIAFFFFFRDAYLVGEASLRPMIGLLPWLLLFFVPAVTMRSLAEERRAGTLELVLAQPVSVAEFLVGKFVGVFLFLAIALAGTLGVPLSLTLGADLQWGVIVAQYIGSVFLVAALVAIGLWSSALTRNQVTAFILGVTVTFALYLIGLDVVVLGLPSHLSTLATRLGILGHFENIARGVIDLRDVLYFVAVTAAFLALTYFALMRERLSPVREAYRRLRLGTVGLVGLAIVASLAGAQLRGRIDLTPGNLYTLSPATRELLRGVDDLVTIRLFRSDEIPPQFAAVARDVEDLLRDFDGTGGDDVTLIRQSPDDDPGAREEARGLGIQPVQFNVFGEAEFQVREGYLGIAIQYADRTETIPFVSDTRDLEYRLASTIHSITRERRPAVAFLGGHGETDASALRGAAARLHDEYRIETLLIDSLITEIPDSLDVVVVNGPSAPLDPRDGELLGAYLQRGGGLFLLHPGPEIDRQRLMAMPAFHPVLDSLLQSWGIRIPPTLVYDVRARQNVQIPGPGGFVVVTPYPLWPYGQPTAGHTISRDVDPIPVRWPTTLEIEEPLDSTAVIPLLTTSEYGGQLGLPVSVEARQDWASLISIEDLGPQLLGAAVLGTPEIGDGRLVVTASASMADEQALASGGPGLVFFQNAIDWLAEEDALIAIRSKDRAPPQLLFESELARDAAKYGNLIGVPLLFILFGMIRLARRRAIQGRSYAAAKQGAA